MSVEIDIEESLPKEEKYKLLIAKINTLIEGEKNLISNTANITSAIKYTFKDFLWTGFYFTDKEKDNELVLGPFQGRVACIRIPFGKGVCGTSALKRETIIVADVNDFPGHIVCDSMSKSEIVVPVIKDNLVMGVLDIDSDIPDNFDNTDKIYLEMIIKNIIHLF